MEPEHTQFIEPVTLLEPVTPPVVPAEPEHTVLVHTYEDDLSKAMTVSDATVVQELLTSAREREQIIKEEVMKRSARGWYTAGSIILLLCALAAATYGAYYYTRLTVPASQNVSIGVFPSTKPIVANAVTVQQLLTDLKTDTTLIEGKPYLIDLVTDQTSLTLLNNAELFSFIGATPSEPFATALGVIRLGVMNTSTGTATFLIASVPQPDIAAKEFLIAEPSLMGIVDTALDINTALIAPETNPTFIGEYRYNLPVRTLYTSDITGTHSLTMLYGSATDNIVVITTKPDVLKAIYDTVIRQQ